MHPRNHAFTLTAAAAIIGLLCAVPAASAEQSLFVRPDNEVDLVVGDCDGGIQYIDAQGEPVQSSPSTILTDPIVDANPAVFVRSANPAGEVDVVATQGSGPLLYFHETTTAPVWYSDTIPGSTGDGDPSIFVRSANPAGEADVVAEGPNNSLTYYHNAPGAPWFGGAVSGASAYSSPSIVVQSNGRAYIAVEGPGASLDLYTATPGSAWSKIVVAANGTTFSAPAVAVRSSGEVDIAAEGPRGNLLYYSDLTPASAGFAVTVVAGPYATNSAPALAVRSANPAGEVDIVAIGLQGQVMYYHLTPPSSGWDGSQIESVGYSLYGLRPSIFVRRDGEADVTTNGSDYLTYSYATPGSAWTSTTLGSGNSCPK